MLFRSKNTEGRAFHGTGAILFQLEQYRVLTVETYPGTDDTEVFPQLIRLKPELVIQTVDLFKSEREITEQMKYYLTDDRVFGKMYYGDVIDFMDLEKLQQARSQVQEAKGKVLVYGFGASLVTRGDCLVYCDMARWEIQLRYRRGMTNYKCSNSDEDILRKYKRGYFIEWRIADKLKQSLLEEIDFLVDRKSVV